MDTKLLRQKILDLAIRGKLVPQDPNDEPASVLLERINAEKERLIKEGKIKRSKKTATTSDSRHYPFELPSGWVWTTIEEISESNIGLTYKPSEISEKGIPVYRSNNIQDRKICLDNLVRVQSTILPKQYLNEGDLLICARNGSRNLVGKCALITELYEPTSFGAFMAVCRSTFNPWIFIVLNSNYFNQYLNDSNSTAINQVTQKMLLSFQIPLPPIQQQKRIVTEIEKWFSWIDIIENGKVDLQTTIKQAKNKILDLAIHGKLVPQDPADEPASELLKRVNPSAEITCDNEHYPHLPNGWILLKGKYVFNPLKSTKPKTDIFKYIDIDSIDNKKQCVRQIKKLAASTAPSRASRYTRKGDVLFAMVRPYLKNIAIVSESDCIASTGFYICSSNGIITTDYCYYLMSSDYVINGLNQYMKGDNSPSISKNDIENWEFPIPPINEQIRITESIKILFSKIDNIAENL